MSPATDKHGRPITDRVVAAMSWGRIAFVVVAGLVAFGSYLTGEIIGAQGIGPRVTALELKVAAIKTEMDYRVKVFYEITGYVKAIARTMGAEVKP